MRSLWPREHGAYAQLAAPIIASLLIGTLHAAAVLLAVAAAMAFLANEPVLVLLGHRGERLRCSEGRRAKRRLYVLGAAATICAVLGLGLAGAATLPIAAAVAIPIVALCVLAWRRGQHSILGEVVAAIALPATAAPIAVAAGVDARSAVALWLAWSVGFAASVLAVHRVIARHRRPASWLDRGLSVVLAALALAIAATHQLLPALPLVAISAVLVTRPPSARHLRTLGVVLVVGSIAGIAIAAQLTRNAQTMRFGAALSRDNVPTISDENEA